MDENSKKSKPNNLKNIARFSGVGIQMGVTIYLGAFAGKWLDEKYPSNKNWFTIGCTLLAVVISIYAVVQELNRYNKNNK